MVRKWQCWNRLERCQENPHYAAAQRERESSRSHTSPLALHCVHSPSPGMFPSSLSVSVWIASTKRASPASRRSSRLALVYSGPAGSRPARTDWCQGILSSQPQESSWTHHTPTLAVLPGQSPPKQGPKGRELARDPETPTLLSLTSQ